jgi:hypothetical protein
MSEVDRVTLQYVPELEGVVHAVVTYLCHGDLFPQKRKKKRRRRGEGEEKEKRDKKVIIFETI